MKIFAMFVYHKLYQQKKQVSCFTFRIGKKVQALLLRVGEFCTVSCNIFWICCTTWIMCNPLVEGIMKVPEGILGDFNGFRHLVRHQSCLSHQQLSQLCPIKPSPGRMEEEFYIQALVQGRTMTMIKGAIPACRICLLLVSRMAPSVLWELPPHTQKLTSYLSGVQTWPQQKLPGTSTIVLSH